MVFILKYGLEKDFKLNLEVNYVILVGYIFEYEFNVVWNYGVLGLIDVN